MSIEPYIQIGDHVLTSAQAMAVRVAVTDFLTRVMEERVELGPIADAYRDRLREVIKLMLAEV